ncbi:MAG TPA: ATP-binding protein [Planktothrix sp.]|jgi:hypothetical protein
MNINGWDPIIPQLAAFFVVLRRRKDKLSPFNLFLRGAPGTHKTEGILELANFLGLSAQVIDASTLDDVSELAGIVDLHANREHGEARVIKGDLLRAEVLVLDEFLNARAHVLPQFRLVLQGFMVMLARRVDMDVRAIIGTGNLTSDMEEGEANLLDSPTADRFALVVHVPSLSEMSKDDINAILNSECDGSFARAFDLAMKGTESHFDQVAREENAKVTAYVCSMVSQLAGSPFTLEGRRAKLLKQFVFAAVALCQSQPDRDLSETIWQVAHDCLTYHYLSGVDLDVAQLKSTHAAAFNATMTDNAIEALIAAENDLATKVSLLMQYRQSVNPISKAGVFGSVIASDDTALKLACVELVRSPAFEGEPKELRSMLERIDFNQAAQPISIGTDQLLALSQMSPSQALAFGLSGGNRERMDELTAKVQQHLARWQTAA